MFDYMDDCIHLKACRRIQAIGRKNRLMVPRYCTTDCTAYVSGECGNYISTSEAVSYARNGAESILRGYDSYDVYCSCDLSGMTLGEILSSMEQGVR